MEILHHSMWHNDCFILNGADTHPSTHLIKINIFKNNYSAYREIIRIIETYDKVCQAVDMKCQTGMRETSYCFLCVT